MIQESADCEYDEPTITSRILDRIDMYSNLIVYTLVSIVINNQGKNLFNAIFWSDCVFQCLQITQ